MSCSCHCECAVPSDSIATTADSQAACIRIIKCDASCFQASEALFAFVQSPPTAPAADSNIFHFAHSLPSILFWAIRKEEFFRSANPSNLKENRVLAVYFPEDAEPS